MLLNELSRLVLGKRLLVLGAGPNEVSLVKRAQELGCFVVVTDNNEDRRLSPCKEIADEAWDISWSDIPTLARNCRSCGIDGVTAGYSEFRVENVIKLCRELHLPCYCSPGQLDKTRDKQKFKDACRRNGVPVVEEFASIEEVEKFPVIVKPVDRAGSIGIGIASDREQLEKVYSEAIDASVEGRVVIERFVESGGKFDSYYSIIDGEVTLLSTDDVILAANNGRDRVVQTAWLLPSKHQRSYEEKVDPAVRRMISDLGLENGYLFISAFVDDNDDFEVFEAGFRLCGGHLYNYFERMGFPNILDLFIVHALTGDIGVFSDMDGRGSNLKCVDVNFYSLPGRIDSIDGFQEMDSYSETIANVQHGISGQICSKGKAILSKIGLVGFCSDNPSVLSARIADCYKTISAKGEGGVDMVYDRIDPAIVEHWWDS